MDIALRPESRAFSISSRYGSQTLAVVTEAAARSVVTAMAGFGIADFGETAGSESVVTSMAGFEAGEARPPHPGFRIAMPAAFRYLPTVSRCTPVVFSIRCRDQPNRPSAMI